MGRYVNKPPGREHLWAMSARKEAEECSEECSETLLQSSCNLKTLKIIIIKTFLFLLAARGLKDEKQGNAVVFGQ